jgi:hypothetical protein
VPPKFDLTQFDEAFFERLRERVAAAGERGMYVAVMLFEGWALRLSPAPDHVEGHPFHAGSNGNGIGISSILDYQVLPLGPRVQELQEAYVRKVVDTLYDLPNVLWEIANEQPSDKGGPFTVMLEPGNYSAEWFSIAGRTTVHRGADDRPQRRRNTFQRVITGVASGRPVLEEGRALKRSAAQAQRYFL